MSLRRLSELNQNALSVKNYGADGNGFTASTSGSHDSSNEHRQRCKTKPKMTESWGEIWAKWPKTTFCIVVNEFCERFSFYGMKTVLQIYLLNVLHFSADNSSVFFNSFTALCYLMPLIGCYIADGFIGKFKTIAFVSVLYAIGQIILALASIANSSSGVHPYLDLVGLFIIALGTGGIKPCVSPFGGDQFEPHESKMISLFFSVFYFSINAGSLISTFASPILRSMPCLGKDSCYPLAFGLPAVLMIVATIAFMLGSFWYKKPLPKSNVFKDVAVVFKKALKNRKGEKRSHWLDYALNGHDCAANPKCVKMKLRRANEALCAEAEFIADIKSLNKLLIMFIPMTVFWSLYDQQGSFWTTQAILMDCRLWGTTLLLPDQMQVVNPVLILVMIFLFESIIYPITSKFFKITSLRKMVTGGLFASLAFLISALVQLKVNTTMPIMPEAGHAYVSVINTIHGCNVTATALGYKPEGVLIPAKKALQNKHNDVQLFHVKTNDAVAFEFNYTSGCKQDVLPKQATFNLTNSYYFFIHISEIGLFLAPVGTDKPIKANGEFSIGFTVALTDRNYDHNLALCRVDGKDASAEYFCNPSQKTDFYFYERDYDGDSGRSTDLIGNFTYQALKKAGNATYATVFKVKDVRPGHWKLYYMMGNAKRRTETQFVPTGIDFTRSAQGGVYMMSLTGRDSETPQQTEFQVVDDNGLSILWQLPQIFVITLSEVLFSLTGNEFSYTQAAPSMKSIAGAFWLLTNFFGDSLIVLLTLIRFTDNYAIMFLVYAIIMAIVVLIIALMSIFYFKYTNYTGDDAREDDSDSEFENEQDGNIQLTNNSDKKQILSTEFVKME